MIEPGRAGAYLALFSEMGLALLVTTLIGALGGRWVDGQPRDPADLVIGGFLAGAGAGARVAYKLIERFLTTIQ